MGLSPNRELRLEAYCHTIIKVAENVYLCYGETAEDEKEKL
jgi:hypothetical protein